MERRGKLGFAGTTQFGRMGRAKLRPFSRRQHESGHHNLNPQVRCSLSLHTAPPLVITYSDGEGADAGVGVAVWAAACAPDEALAGYMAMPSVIRRLWSRQRANTDLNDIYQIEAIGPLLVLTTWPEILRNSMWVHVIDNEAALASLVKGSSSVMEGDVIVGETWRLISELHVVPWFDREDTNSNPVDGLSRKRLDGPWKLVPPSFPCSLGFITPSQCSVNVSPRAVLR